MVQYFVIEHCFSMFKDVDAREDSVISSDLYVCSDLYACSGTDLGFTHEDDATEFYKES